jgi:hypothetical protein
MNRKSDIMPTVFKSEEKSQTYCQKEERFTVQNKMTDASPYKGTNPKSKAFYSTQILICQVERSAVQNKKTRAIETALRFCEKTKESQEPTR